MVDDKAPRVANFQRGTLEAFRELLGAAGLTHPEELEPRHILRRISPTKIETYAQIYGYLEPGDLLEGDVAEFWRPHLARIDVERFCR